MAVPLIDIHTHHTSPMGVGVLRFNSLRLTEDIPQVYRYSLGLHPWFGEDLTEYAWERLSWRCRREPVWAIGEAGLDRLSAVSLDEQMDYFARQASLSEELGLPLVVHCVRAWGELLSVRRDYSSMPWVIHGFRGKEALAEQLIGAGCWLSFGECYQVDAMRLAYESGRLLLETDARAMDIVASYERVARDLGLSVEAVAEDIYTRLQTLL